MQFTFNPAAQAYLDRANDILEAVETVWAEHPERAAELDVVWACLNEANDRTDTGNYAEVMRTRKVAAAVTIGMYAGYLAFAAAYSPRGRAFIAWTRRRAGAIADGIDAYEVSKADRDDAYHGRPNRADERHVRLHAS